MPKCVFGLVCISVCVCVYFNLYLTLSITMPIVFSVYMWVFYICSMFCICLCTHAVTCTILCMCILGQVGAGSDQDKCCLNVTLWQSIMFDVGGNSAKITRKYDFDLQH